MQLGQAQADQVVNAMNRVTVKGGTVSYTAGRYYSIVCGENIIIWQMPVTLTSSYNALASDAINFTHTADFLFTDFIDNLFPEPVRPLLFAICCIACWWTFLYFLYRQKIFLKV